MKKYTILAQTMCTDLEGLPQQPYLHLWFVEAPSYLAALRRVTNDALPGFRTFLVAAWDGFNENFVETSPALFIHRDIRADGDMVLS